MRPKSLMLLLLALGCGLVASIGISQVIESRNRAAAPAMEKEPIYVATQDIKVNQPLTPQIVNLEEWPKEKIPADAIRDLKEIQGQRSGTTILAGEPLRKAKFAMDKRIDEIPAGYRVVAVSADAVSSAGYLLQPGDRVDVLMYVGRTAKPYQNNSAGRARVRRQRAMAAGGRQIERIDHGQNHLAVGDARTGREDDASHGNGQNPPDTA
jgi:pilus assembly protein CpaB